MDEQRFHQQRIWDEKARAEAVDCYVNHPRDHLGSSMPKPRDETVRRLTAAYQLIGGVVNVYRNHEKCCG